MKARRILSLDGGGIRGLVTGLWLQGAENALKQAGKPGLRDSFDLYAGSSSGALIACGLANGLAPAQIVALYREQRHRIFPGMAQRLWSRAGRFFRDGPSAPKYDGRGLDEVLREAFGETTMGQLEPPVMVTGYDTVSRTPIIFKSFKREHQNLPVWQVCRASASAPTYFPAFAMPVENKPRSMIDGGVVANNPTALAIAEAMRRDQGVTQCSDLTVLSVGSGARNRPISLRQAQEWGALEWAVPIIDVLFDGNTDSVDYIARQLVGDGYFRLQTDLTTGLDDTDDTSATNIAALDRLATNYLRRKATRESLDELARRL
ncbi:MAG: patatin-like phospholipase family protein [Gammaproteobacteria bacterium]